MDMVPIVVSIIGFFSAVVVSVASSIITLYVQSERVKSEYKKVSLEFKKELASRLNEKKWEVYSGYIAWTSERISHIGGNDPHNAKQIYQELSTQIRYSQELVGPFGKRNGQAVAPSVAPAA